MKSNSLIGWLAVLGVFLIVLFFVYSREPATNQTVITDPTEAGEDSPTPDEGVSIGDLTDSYRERLQDLQTRAAESPTDTTVLRQLAHLLHDAHQMDEAIDVYKDILEITPKHRQTMLDLATAYATSKKWEESESLTRELLEMDDEDVFALYNMGTIRANLNDIEGAIGWFKKAADTARDSSLIISAQRAITFLEANPEGPR